MMPTKNSIVNRNVSCLFTKFYLKKNQKETKEEEVGAAFEIL